MTALKIAVVRATGAVGIESVKLLEDSHIPVFAAAAICVLTLGRPSADVSG